MAIRPSAGRILRVHRLVSGPPPPFDAWPEDGGHGGGCVCFVCGRSVRGGAPIVIVSRLWQSSPTGEERLKEVHCATSSLQVCVPCTVRAADCRVRFVHTPRLVSPELAAFYCYARAFAHGLAVTRCDTQVERIIPTYNLLALPEHRLLPPRGSDRYLDRQLNIVGDDKCYRCGGDIRPGTSHMLIEIAVHSDFRRAVRLSNIWPVSKHCRGCSIRLLPIDSNDRLDPNVW